MQENPKSVLNEDKENYKSSPEQPKDITLLGKIEVFDIRRNGRGPRPVAKYKEPINKPSSFEGESVADAMTEDFRISMSDSLGYNDNIDMDQQSQEYWNNV